MLPRIVHAIVAGQSSRQIAAWVIPAVAHTTIFSYAKNTVAPVMADAEALKALLRANRDENKPLPPELHGATSEQQIEQRAKNAIVGSHILTLRDNRVAIQTDRHRRLMQVISERGEDMELCESCRKPRDAHPWEDDTSGRYCDTFHAIPGGTTGLVVRKLKATGIEYAVDTGVLAELRETEKQVAIELGQWNENAGGSGISIQIICPQAPELESAPRISYSESDQLTLESGVCADIGVIQKK